MNYIELIRSFWTSHNQHSFNTTEIALYFYMIEVFNLCHWKDQIKRNNRRVEADLGISFVTLKNARNKLQQAGVLFFETKTKNANVSYTLSLNVEVSAKDGTIDTTIDDSKLVSAKDKLNNKPNKTLSSDVKVDELYNLYPSRCVVKNSPTGKSKKNKDKIAKLIDEVGYDKLSDAIKWYVEECKVHKTYMMNFSTFLNNLPEIPEEKEDIKPITQLTDRQGNIAQ